MRETLIATILSLALFLCAYRTRTKTWKEAAIATGILLLMGTVFITVGLFISWLAS